MGDNELSREDTELVDVSEVSEAIPETTVASEEDEAAEQIYLERRATVANLRERFAAFFIDCIIFFYLYFLIGIVARRAFYHSWSGPIPSFGWQGLAFHGIFAFCCFMYYFVLEGIFFTTIGKFCCWMSVRRKDGRYASMSAIFARNIFRFVDYALPFVPYFCMELTALHQRFGDLIAKTTVIKKHKTEQERFGITNLNVASASGRAVSFLIDLCIFGSLTFGYSLLLSPDRILVSRWMLLLSPLVPFLYFVITESSIHTTPGKWIFGYAISHEDGVPVSFSGAVVRTFMRLFDMNVVGLMAMWLSPKRQRFGDLVGDTIVTKQRRNWHGAVALVVWAAIAGTVLWTGMQNSSSYLHSAFKFNFAPAVEFLGTADEESPYKELTITHVRLAAGDANTIRTPAVFQQNETVFVLSDVYGYEKSGRMVWLQEDIDVKYPDQSIGLHQENIIDYHQVVPSNGAVELTNSIKLPDNAQDGTYTITLTVRDLFGHENAVIKQTFEVKGPTPVVAPTPVAPPTPAVIQAPRPSAPATKPTQPVPAPAAPIPPVQPATQPPSLNAVPPGAPPLPPPDTRQPAAPPQIPGPNI